jgi:L-serine dehydratase
MGEGGGVPFSLHTTTKNLGGEARRPMVCARGPRSAAAFKEHCVVSAFELFKIGIGPSSSHTVGPMRAAHAFASGLGENLPAVTRVRVILLGSLAFTGHGHATDRAVLLGLAGETPDQVDPDEADRLFAQATTTHRLNLLGRHPITFDPAADLVFDRTGAAPQHPNTMAFLAFGADGQALAAERWCSVGGGFVARENDLATPPESQAVAVPHPFRNGRELLAEGERTGLSIAAMIRANELAWRPAADLDAHLARVIETMMACIDRGMAATGLLPGKLAVRRRAAGLVQKLRADRHSNTAMPTGTMDWVSVFAIAVNEENAAGGRVVTAPTNGAAGVVPAVLRYYRDMVPASSEAGMQDFLLAATAIGGLFKLNASISGAEVGCQGEVGVACAMAAGGLTAAMGGTNEMVENAAEIGMEHHLGMTCDPVGGLVQIPCIERNAFGAIKAINAASLALRGDGRHHISLDQVIATMRQTGLDMQSKYKETSLGGLAVNFTEC